MADRKNGGYPHKPGFVRDFWAKANVEADRIEGDDRVG